MQQLGKIELEANALGHCHDTKTVNDGLAGGMHLDKHQITEEPDEGKLSRPVLKTSRSGDGAA